MADTTPLLVDSAVARFAARFAGYHRAFGMFTQEAASDGLKVRGKSRTVRGEPTLQHYAAHLKGDGPGLGIIMLQGDERAVFGAIDLDDPTMDHEGWAKRLAKLDLPLVLCRSKSGGGHFYLFLSEPIPGDQLRRRLTEYAALLGLPPQTEIFPKQTQRLNEDDPGSWINLPYFNHSITDRGAYDAKGQRLNVHEFLDLADQRAQPAEPMAATVLPVLEDTMFRQGPPCLQHFEAQGGFPHGGKRNGMFNVGVYLRRAFPDDWETRLSGYNDRMASLTNSEVQEIIKSLKRKNYQYKCTDVPISAVCQKAICKTRVHGVGTALPGQGGMDGTEDTRCDITSVTKYVIPDDNPLWYIELEVQSGRVYRIRLTHDEFFHVNAFNKRCFAEAGIIPAKVPQPKWLAYAEALAQTADVVPLPEDAAPAGQLMLLVREFLDMMPRAPTKESFQSGGKVYIEAGRIAFRSADLRRFLETQRFVMPLTMVYDYLRREGANSVQWHIDTRVIRVWTLPFDPQESVPPPAADRGDMVDPNQYEPPFKHHANG